MYSLKTAQYSSADMRTYCIRGICPSSSAASSKKSPISIFSQKIPANYVKPSSANSLRIIIKTLNIRNTPELVRSFLSIMIFV